MDARDILEVRINKVMKKSTVQINNSVICQEKSKDFIIKIEQGETETLTIGDHVNWEVKSLIRTSTAVIRGIPKQEEGNRRYQSENR